MAHQVLQALRAAGNLYLQRASVAYAARVRGDLFARLTSPDDRTDPYEIYASMRARGPMLPTRLGNFTTTSHRICSEVLRSRSFGVNAPDGSDWRDGGMLDLSLLFLDPPDHTRLRRLAAPVFTARRIAAFTPLVDVAVDRLLDAAEGRDTVDLMTAFASPLPIAVVTRLLGLPADTDRFRRLGSVIARALDGVWSLRQGRELLAADRELTSLFDELLVRRAAEPGEDLVSAFLASPDSGRPEPGAITGGQLAALARLLLIAGFETTVNAIGNGVRWLLHDRSQWELLVADPAGRAPAVVEEVLRFDPPVQQTVRVAHADVEVGGHPVAQGQWVVTLLAAANRDPEVFADPDRFDVTRDSAAEHLAFSGGIHYCLGAALARLELVCAFRALAERYPHLEPAGPVVMRPGTTLRGPARLPVRLRGASRSTAA